MMNSMPEPIDPFEPKPSPPAAQQGIPWGVLDIVVFGVFFGLTILVLPALLVWILRMFNPSVQITSLSATVQVLFQGVMDLILAGFITFLIKVVHREPFFQAIRWYRNYDFSNRSLAVMGATLALSVLVVSYVFPTSEPTRIEQLISSTKDLYVFALFGIGVAPLFEEVIFRGFLFRAFFEIGGSSLAIFSTALLFTMLHIPQIWGSWAAVVLIFIVGYILSAVRARSGSLIPSFIIHTTYNAMLFGIGALSTFVQKGL
jgi:membrane protease YdiL (CAAX protease family)